MCWLFRSILCHFPWWSVYCQKKIMAAKRIDISGVILYDFSCAKIYLHQPVKSLRCVCPYTILLHNKEICCLRFQILIVSIRIKSYQIVSKWPTKYIILNKFSENFLILKTSLRSWLFIKNMLICKPWVYKMTKN